MQLQGESWRNPDEKWQKRSPAGRCIIWRHKLIRPWKSQVSDTIRRRLIKPISHLSGLALPLSLSLLAPSFCPSYLVCSLSLFRLYRTLFFLLRLLFFSFSLSLSLSLSLLFVLFFSFAASCPPRAKLDARLTGLISTQTKSGRREKLRVQKCLSKAGEPMNFLTMSFSSSESN